MEEDHVWKVFAQIIMGLNECHHFKSGVIVHRDIKPENVFLDSQNNYKVHFFIRIHNKYKYKYKYKYLNLNINA